MTHKPLALVIDDDLMLGETFAMALDMAGFAVETLSQPREALEHARRIRPALITLDLQMPGISGDRLLSMLRAEPTLKATRILIISADSGSMNLPALEQADMVLLKPVSVAQVMEIARRLIARPAANIP